VRRQATALALSWLLAACGGATPSEPVAPIEESVAESEEPTPYPREAALPAAPSAVIDIDLDVLRETPLYANIREAMDGDSPADVLGRRMIERTNRVHIGLYAEGRDVVLIAYGSFEGVMDEVLADLARGRQQPARVERSGFDLHYIEDDLVVVQTADDTIVLSEPPHIDEVLRAASGSMPATPLPLEMRELLERPGLSDAPMRTIFAARREPGSDPLERLVSEAGFAGVGGRVENGRIVAVGAARAPSELRASQLAAELEQYARDADDEDVRSATLAEGIRAATVRADARWVEFSLSFPSDDIQHFMRIVRPLGGL
jgi:hypothetical protein